MSLLNRNEYAVFKEVKTQTITTERQDEREQRDGESKKAKLFIRLEKHADFDKNYEKFEQLKAENDKAVGARKTTVIAAAE